MPNIKVLSGTTVMLLCKDLARKTRDVTGTSVKWHFLSLADQRKDLGAELRLFGAQMLRLFNLSAFNTDPHHSAAAYGLQLGDADLDPGCVEILEQYLRDVLGECLEQVEVAAGQHFL